jgi:hypothetical protein
MAVDDLSPDERKALGLGQLLLQAKDPAAQEEWKRLARKIKPDLQFPELDLRDQMKSLDDRQAKWEEKQEARSIEDRTARRHEKEDRAAEAAGFTADEIRKLAQDEGIGSFDAALKFATLQRETAEPSADTYGGPTGRGPADVLPPDWRKMTPAERIRRGQKIAHEGITDMLRRARTGR